jgi:hypothetical protein
MAPYGLYLIGDFHDHLVGQGELVGAGEGVSAVGKAGGGEDGGGADGLRAGIHPLAPRSAGVRRLCGWEGTGLWVQCWGNEIGGIVG